MRKEKEKEFEGDEKGRERREEMRSEEIRKGKDRATSKEKWE